MSVTLFLNPLSIHSNLVSNFVGAAQLESLVHSSVVNLSAGAQKVTNLKAKSRCNDVDVLT
jgi:hypothetical protein